MDDPELLPLDDVTAINDEWRRYSAKEVARTVETATAKTILVEVGDVVIRQPPDSAGCLYEFLIDGVPQTRTTEVVVRISAGKFPVVQITRLALRKKKNG